MRHVVRMAVKEKVVEALLELIVGRRNDVVEIEDYFRIIPIPAKGKNFHRIKPPASLSGRKTDRVESCNSDLTREATHPGLLSAEVHCVSKFSSCEVPAEACWTRTPRRSPLRDRSRPRAAF